METVGYIFTLTDGFFALFPGTNTYTALKIHNHDLSISDLACLCTFDDRLNKALSRLGLPNKREVEELEQRVQELTSALSKAEEDVHAAPESEAPKRRSRKKS